MSPTVRCSAHTRAVAVAVARFGAIATDALIERLPAREDRDASAPLFTDVTAARLRTAITRACRNAGVPSFSPHDLRHRRISLMHVQGVSWAEIGAKVGQRNIAITANRYTHVMVDYREVDRQNLLERVRAVSSSVTLSDLELR